MIRFFLVLIAACVVGCSTAQVGFRPLGPTYPARPADAPVELFETGAPTRAFERIARVDAHFEHTAGISTPRERAIEELKKQARASGSDAIIEIRTQRSEVGETLILHVTGIGIRYTAP